MRIAMAGAALLALGACNDRGPNPNNAPSADEPVANSAAAAPAIPGDPAPVADRITASNGQQYVDLAGAIDLFEIESARLALEKSQQAEIRAFAQMLLRDHGRSAARIAAAARAAEPRLNVRSALNPTQRAEIAALRRAAPADFDRLFLDQQMRAHETALGLFTDYASVGDVEGLRVHASQVAAPVLEHLSRVRSLSEGTVAEQIDAGANSAR